METGPAPPQRRRPCALRAAHAAWGAGAGNVRHAQPRSGDKAVGALNIEQWPHALHMHEDVRPHEKCHGDCYQMLVNCYVEVMLSASVGDDPLSTRPSASSTSTPPVGAAPWLPPAANVPIEKSCSARRNGWPQPQFLLSIEYFLRLLRLLLLRSVPAFFLFAQYVTWEDERYC